MYIIYFIIFFIYILFFNFIIFYAFICSRATVLRENISQLEKEAKFELPSIRDVETVRVFLGRLQNIRRSCLEASIQALKEGHLLLDKLKELRKLGSIDSRPDFMAGQVNTGKNFVFYR